MRVISVANPSYLDRLKRNKRTNYPSKSTRLWIWKPTLLVKWSFWIRAWGRKMNEAHKSSSCNFIITRLFSTLFEKRTWKASLIVMDNEITETKLNTSLLLNMINDHVSAANVKGLYISTGENIFLLFFSPSGSRKKKSLFTSFMEL